MFLVKPNCFSQFVNKNILVKFSYSRNVLNIMLIKLERERGGLFRKFFYTFLKMLLISESERETFPKTFFKFYKEVFNSERERLFRILFSAFKTRGFYSERQRERLFRKLFLKFIKRFLILRERERFFRKIFVNTNILVKFSHSRNFLNILLIRLERERVTFPKLFSALLKMLLFRE